MYTAFLAVATACGTPPMLAAVALGQLSNLMGCLTTYGIGSAPPYFGAGYVPQVTRREAWRKSLSSADKQSAMGWHALAMAAGCRASYVPHVTQ
jgi:hypothetical protein